MTTFFDLKRPNSTWCWPFSQKEYAGPSHLNLSNCHLIPNGSIYVCRQDKDLSEINLRLTGCPYDTIGIVFQSTHSSHLLSNDFEILDLPTNQGSRKHQIRETYVYLVTDRVQIISLKKLIQNSRIQDHAILPLREISLTSSSTPHSKYIISSKESLNPSLQKIKFQRNQILRDLFFQYLHVNLHLDRYQTLAAFSSVHDSFDSHGITGPELVGLILYQAGFLWDDRLNTQFHNPACYRNQNFFSAFCEKENSGTVIHVLTDSPHLQDESWREDEQNNFKDDISSEDEESPLHENICQPIFQKPLHTIPFRSLHIIDFLKNAFPGSWKSSPMSSNPDLEFFISSCQKYPPFSQINLNLSWYEPTLVPISLSSSDLPPTSSLWEKVLPEINLNLLQKKILLPRSSSQILKICQDLSELSQKLHEYASQTQAMIMTPSSRKSVSEKHCFNQASFYIYFPHLNSGHYELIIPSYMWSLNWNYHWESYHSENQIDMNSFQKYRRRACELILEIPSDWILLELAQHLLLQTQRIYKYLTHFEISQ